MSACITSTSTPGARSSKASRARRRAVLEVLELISAHRRAMPAQSVPRGGRYASDKMLFSLLCAALPYDSDSLAGNGVRARLAMMKWTWLRLIRRLEPAIRQVRAGRDHQHADDSRRDGFVSEAARQGCERRMIGVMTDFGVHDFWKQPASIATASRTSRWSRASTQAFPHAREVATGVPLMPDFAYPMSQARSAPASCSCRRTRRSCWCWAAVWASASMPPPARCLSARSSAPSDRHARSQQRARARVVERAGGATSGAPASLRVDRSHGRVSARGGPRRRQARRHHASRKRWPAADRCSRRVRSAVRKDSTSIFSSATVSAAWSADRRVVRAGRSRCLQDRDSLQHMQRRAWLLGRRDGAARIAELAVDLAAVSGRRCTFAMKLAASIGAQGARASSMRGTTGATSAHAGAGVVSRAGALPRPRAALRGRHAAARQRSDRPTAFQQREHRGAGRGLDAARRLPVREADARVAAHSWPKSRIRIRRCATSRVPGSDVASGARRSRRIRQHADAEELEDALARAAFPTVDVGVRAGGAHSRARAAPSRGTTGSRARR